MMAKRNVDDPRLCLIACHWAQTLPPMPDDWRDPVPECRGMRSGSFGYSLSVGQSIDGCKGYEPKRLRSNGMEKL